MLEIRLCCECCGVALPPDADNAYICSLECTWCGNCVSRFPEGECPNCGGNLERRPQRDQRLLAGYPPSACAAHAFSDDVMLSPRSRHAPTTRSSAPAVSPPRI